MVTTELVLIRAGHLGPRWVLLLLLLLMVKELLILLLLIILLLVTTLGPRWRLQAIAVAACLMVLMWMGRGRGRGGLHGWEGSLRRAHGNELRRGVHPLLLLLLLLTNGSGSSCRSFLEGLQPSLEREGEVIGDVEPGVVEGEEVVIARCTCQVIVVTTKRPC